MSSPLPHLLAHTTWLSLGCSASCDSIRTCWSRTRRGIAIVRAHGKRCGDDVAFIGVECTTILGSRVCTPEKTIPRATLLRTVIAAAVYIACTLAVMGLLPAATLAYSQAPFADAVRVL